MSRAGSSEDTVVSEETTHVRGRRCTIDSAACGIKTHTYTLDPSATCTMVVGR